MSLRVYALTNPAPLVRPPRGIDGERLRLIVVGPVAAVVGDAKARRVRAGPTALRRYDAVVGRLAGSRASVLPARFATLFADPEELAIVLRSREVSLRTALARVRRRVQMTVRVPDVNMADPLAGALPPESPGEAGSAGAGAGYLRARAASAARARVVPGFDPVRAAVRRWVRAEQVERKAGIASVYHLVPRASADVYRRTLERAAAANRLRLVVSGPWAPYAFTGW